MPYIPPQSRWRLNGDLPQPESAGELNYILTKVVWEYIGDHGLSYATLNEVVGVLECAKAELLRRVVGPYEDEKITENGDVY
jgi:hypothetical protein